MRENTHLLGVFFFDNVIDEMAIFLLSSTHGRVAEWLGTGLQNPLLRFKSGRDLNKIGSVVELVYTADLKSAALDWLVGSSPT